MNRPDPTDRSTGGRAVNPGDGEPVAPSFGAALDEVVASVDGLVDSFTAAGYRLYLVGGAVRDLLVATSSDPAADPGVTGRSVTGAELDQFDLDFTTEAVPSEITRLVDRHASAVWTQGERFGTIGAKIGSRLVEITTHRAEAYDASSRKPAVTFGLSIDDDLARRDFTINAIAASLPDGGLVDPFGGRAALAAGVLETPLEPDVSFTDDPLRMLRAARFLARFHLTPAPELVAAATDGAPRLAIVSAERVQAELEKQLTVSRPEPGFGFLDRTGVLDHVVPELSSVAPRDRAEALALVAAPGSPLVRRAGLLLPLGTAGAAGMLRRLRYGRADTTDTTLLLEAAEAVLGGDVTDRLVRTVVDSIGLAGVPEVVQLVDNVRRHRQLPDPNPFQATVARLADGEDLDDLEPPVGGGDLIDELGLEPGPIVGRAMAHLKACRLETGPMTAAEAIAEVQAWLRNEAGDDRVGRRR